MSAYRAAVRIVARADKVPVASIVDARRHPERRRRHLAAYLAHVVAGVPLARVAADAGVARSALREGMSKVEDQRELPDVDARISSLEEAMQCAI